MQAHKSRLPQRHHCINSEAGVQLCRLPSTEATTGSVCSSCDSTAAAAAGDDPAHHSQVNTAQLRPEEGSERKKKWAPRARTGCITCRTRRVKCDETQPACKKCSLSNRECLWATLQHHAPSFSPGAGADMAQQPSLSVSPRQIPRRHHEVQLFHYFRAEVAPQLAGLFDQDFWRDELLRSTQSQPILWHACNAIAATHLLDWTSGGGGSSSAPPALLPLQPYYQYQAALQSMRRLVALPFVTDTTRISMIVASQLFVVLAALRGDNAEMTAHYQNTCMLVGLWRTWAQTRIHRRRDRHTVLAADSVVYACFRADSLLLFLQPPGYRYHSYWDGCTLRLRDDPFVSLTEAYFELEPVWNNVVKAAVHPGPEVPDFITDGGEFTQHVLDHYKERIAKWERKLDALRRQRCGGDAQDAPRLAVLELRAATVKMLLYTFALEVSALCWDACTADFGRLLDGAKRLMEMRYAAARRQDTPSVTTAVGDTPGRAGRLMALSPMTNETLHLVARLCRAPALRRRACALLAHDYHLAPSVHTLVYMHLADAQMRFEEAEWQQAEPGARCGATRMGSAACECSRARSFVCDGHRVYQTALEDMTATGAVLLLRTVDGFAHSRPWRRLPLYFTLQKKELVCLAEL
ncbi:C6 zinc finger domain [Cordyceps militaris]|uniref:C6 zinc finger domain n=1 Tax=Cordyceps militaris TaxID=73501 RepID=A0A2H4SIQ7_CORMI|nr:C6 zinc finger domain [Cordyceps militaris]